MNITKFIGLFKIQFASHLKWNRWRVYKVIIGLFRKIVYSIDNNKLIKFIKNSLYIKLE